MKPVEPGPGPAETAAFFSGGVDSFYTLLRNKEARDRESFPAIDRLLCVWGFDIDLGKPGEYERLRSQLSEAAGDLGVDLVDVAMNLQEVRFQETEWGRLSHGSALASIALALERRFRTVYIAATYTGGTPIKPWGSHPETDPLFSTSHMRIIHDGAGVARIEKTEYVSRSDVAMRSLHVCPRERSSENCCDCRKCFLVMLTLEVIGALSRCSVFRRRAIDLERVKRTLPPGSRIRVSLSADRGTRPGSAQDGHRGGDRPLREADASAESPALPDRVDEEETRSLARRQRVACGRARQFDSMRGSAQSWTVCW